MSQFKYFPVEEIGFKEWFNLFRTEKFSLNTEFDTYDELKELEEFDSGFLRKALREYHDDRDVISIRKMPDGERLLIMDEFGNPGRILATALKTEVAMWTDKPKKYVQTYAYTWAKRHGVKLSVTKIERGLYRIRVARSVK